MRITSDVREFVARIEDQNKGFRVLEEFMSHCFLHRISVKEARGRSMPGLRRDATSGS